MNLKSLFRKPTVEKLFQSTHDEQELEKELSNKKLKLLSDFDKNFLIQAQTLKVILNAKKHADKNGMKSNQVFWNAAGFINMSSFDLKVIVKEMLFAENEWARRYFARQTSHLIYELIDDIFEILGKEFKNHIEKISDNNHLKKALIEVRAELNAFKDEYYEKLGLIRNVSSAHRDKDFIKQYDVIYSISFIDTFTISSRFDRVMIRLGGIIQEIISRSSGELDRS
jgi:hypothetical protein